MVASADELIGSVFGGYRLERILGAGGTGAVFLGRREEPPHEEVAIKVLMPPLQLSTAQRHEFQTRFKHEAQALAQLTHPHTLPIRAYGEDEATGLSYIVLPYVAGGTLAERLTHGPLPLEEAGRYAEQLAEVLDYAHSRGIVHRDVKPANVLLNPDGQAYLVDFSIVRLFNIPHTTVSTTGQILGTPAYMAPEQASGSAVGPAADIYGLGLLLYHLVAGRPPFEGDSLIEFMNKHLLEAPPSPRQFRPDLPEPAAATLLHALAKRPVDRFATAADLAHAFNAGLRGRWVPGVLPNPPLQRSTDPIGLPDDLLRGLGGPGWARRPGPVIGLAVLTAIVVAVTVLYSAQILGSLFAHGL